MKFAKTNIHGYHPPAKFATLSKTANMTINLVLEFIVYDIFDLAKVAACHHRRILPRHVRMAIDLDRYLKYLCESNITTLFFHRPCKDPIIGNLGKFQVSKTMVCTEFICKKDNALYR